MPKTTVLLKKIEESFPETAKKVARILAKGGMSKEDIGDLKQKLKPAEPIGHGIPTLKPGVFKKPSPMIAERFKYAGSWKQIDQVWLGISEMEKALKKKSVREVIKSLREYWEGSAPAVFPPERLSLFAITDGAEEDQTYLVWPEKGGTEPEVWEYSGQAETQYKNLEKYLEHVLKS